MVETSKYLSIGRLMLFVSVIVVVCVFASTSSPTNKAGKMVTVEVKRRTSDKQWKPYETRLIEHLVDFVPEQVTLSKYGGLKDATVEATGFFHTRKIDGRWWLVDPQGCLFLTVGVCAVGTNPTERGRDALRKQFGDEAGWSRATNAVLWEMGYNTLGCWSQWEKFVATEPRLPYTTQLNFMSSYGKIRGGTYQKPGHTGYPNDCIFAFDPQFATFCERHARERLSATKDDPYLLGHFSDNEMPFPRDLLDRYLSLDKSDPGYKAAKKWCSENNVEKGLKGFATRDREAFIEFVAATYYSIVSQAIKRADPNHLYLGSRLHGSDLKRATVWKGAGPYVDAIAVNYYGAWTPDPELMTNWVTWSGKPFFVTEWYAKGMDSGLGNVTGAGWTVKTQADRGKFYQNFTLGLLEHPGCVGWHWFKYMDNDPTNLRTDPSNRDSNKGFVSSTYEPWTPLVKAMTAINRQVYPLREFLNSRPDELVTLANVADPGQITADEPIADVFSAEKAARYLDISSLHWQKSHNCVSCHGNLGYMFARPALSSVLKDSGEVRRLYEEYVTKRWKQKPPNDAQEIVVVASGLTFNDLETTGRLHPITRQALQMMWDFQRDDGGWTWHKEGYPPTESDEHYGVTLAALITGIAPDRYVETQEARRGLEKIRVFLKNNPPLSLHHRAMIAWASCYVGDLMNDQQRAKTLDELLALQRPDGGWSTPGLLADWKDFKRLDGKPQDTKTSDAYATGFTIIVARELGMSSDDPRLQRGIDWLLSNQRVSGKWFCRSPSKDSRHYFSNFGSAFAILALQSCDRLPGWPL